ncbi:MAG: hypothetical protein BWY10_01948 [Chloroflexi bacterium ADurb.Bin180]|nr:MAG: hypothetical protein BWY10_01948 [Chloroflexi bacterium ADurb.Bin180]HOU23261.1 PIN domain-containing protein [Anaerolineae bacterium]HQJ51193.1 PIN domain-containing protein [Anaerolineae bacterium]
MTAKARVFLDTSVLVAGALSETGGSRAVLKLGELNAVDLLVGPRVLAEADEVLTRKAPQSKATLALVLDRARVAVGPEPGKHDVARASAAVTYKPDAHILAEALAAKADYLVTLDKAHLLGNHLAGSLPLLISSPGDLLALLRAMWQESQRGTPATS